MINFIPSKGILKKTEIDFDLLGDICTKIFEAGFNRKIYVDVKVWKSRVKEQSSGVQHMFYMKSLIEGDRIHLLGSITDSASVGQIS